MQATTSLSKLFWDNTSKRSFCVEAYYLTLWRKIQNYNDVYSKIENLDIITLFLISWRFDSISNIGIENRVESSQVDFKIIEIELNFKSISNVEIVESSRFQKLESKLDLMISLDLTNLLNTSFFFTIVIFLNITFYANLVFVNIDLFFVIVFRQLFVQFLATNNAKSITSNK